MIYETQNCSFDYPFNHSNSFFNMGWNSTSAYSTNSQIQNSILYVKPAVTGTTCSSWVDPCELQAALDIATDGDQIWVVEGPITPAFRLVVKPPSNSKLALLFTAVLSGTKAASPNAIGRLTSLP